MGGRHFRCFWNSPNSIYCRCFRKLFGITDTVKLSLNFERTKINSFIQKKVHQCPGGQTSQVLQEQSKSVQIAYIVQLSPRSIYCRDFRNFYSTTDTVQRHPNIEVTKHPFNHSEINSCVAWVADSLGSLGIVQSSPNKI